MVLEGLKHKGDLLDYTNEEVNVFGWRDKKVQNYFLRGGQVYNKVVSLYFSLIKDVKCITTIHTSKLVNHVARQRGSRLAVSTKKSQVIHYFF